MRRSLSLRTVGLVGAVLVAVLILPAAAAAAPVLTDSYAFSNGDGGWHGVGGPWAIPYVGQTFTANVGGTLDSAVFALADYFNNGDPLPTGEMRAQLFAVTGTYGVDSHPTGPPLATSASVEVSTAGLPRPPASKLIKFSFDKTYVLSAGTRYAIMVNYTEPFAIVAQGDGTSPTHSGNTAQLYGWWRTYVTDTVFEVYVNPPTSTSAASTLTLSVLAAAGLVVAFIMRRRTGRP